MRPKFANVIIYDDRSVLLQLRDNDPNIGWPGIWCLPGGHIEQSESPKEAIIRECFEETNYNLKNPKQFRKYQYDYIEGKPWEVVFSEKYDGKQKIICKEGQKMEFIHLSDLEDKEIFPTLNK